ncbi:hypothetical protein PGTUg99_013596 [Puccinia graminis f. sp. tritici]|uniref:Uncharacterized protein n=2 Tax=Puccinia graminis f. sp. tritici TaxID=56615 RepID=E3KR40_PUCGT|nr:uncharacterized protein PGTG_13147 [Puccinia graminis f. sp. tritici CRL 75-36-700-3]EFP86765.1 hypothetical protein PGTG_13147 [Puccinia graminis f. sp. tritici CRL 75-36-700-3]KAA1102544.1 hypothetical protein PGTUg99_013596 [Puccinia graminis f. sp. tritici]
MRLVGLIVLATLKHCAGVEPPDECLTWHRTVCVRTDLSWKVNGNTANLHCDTCHHDSPSFQRKPCPRDGGILEPMYGNRQCAYCGYRVEKGAHSMICKTCNLSPIEYTLQRKACDQCGRRPLTMSEIVKIYDDNVLPRDRNTYRIDRPFG